MNPPSDYLALAYIIYCRELLAQSIQLPDSFQLAHDFVTSSYEVDFSQDLTIFSLKKLQKWGFIQIVSDPYADELIIYKLDKINAISSHLSHVGMADLFAAAMHGGRGWFGRVFAKSLYWSDFRNELQNSGSDGDIEFKGAMLPASDRFVDIRDNQREASEAIELLEELESQIRVSNECGAIFGDDKDAVADEVKSIRDLISKPRIRPAIILEYARSALGWIADKAGAAAIGDLAKKALSYIFDWLS